jgi:GNAT superfamily N-acetyltransferase
MIFRTAETPDAPAIAALVNRANSGDGGQAGWTHEAHLLAGDRTDAAEILELIQAPGAIFQLLVDSEGIAGCVYLKGSGEAAYLGLLAVRPTLQGGGIGKQLVAEAERIARDEWERATMQITVFTAHRPELTAFYERRGYVRTGRFKLPERKGASANAKVEGLVLEWMAKGLRPARGEGTAS